MPEDTFTENIVNFSSEGVNHQGIFRGVQIWQEPAGSWAVNTLYILTVAVGNRVGFTVPDNISMIYLEAGPVETPFVLAAGGINASTLPDMAFEDLTIQFFTGNIAPIGPVRIRLSAEGYGRSHFDNVRLTAESWQVPEPSVLCLAGLFVTASAARRRRGFSPSPKAPPRAATK